MDTQLEENEKKETIKRSASFNQLRKKTEP